MAKRFDAGRSSLKPLVPFRYETFEMNLHFRFIGRNNGRFGPDPLRRVLVEDIDTLSCFERRRLTPKYMGPKLGKSRRTVSGSTSTSRKSYMERNSPRICCGVYASRVALDPKQGGRSTFHSKGGGRREREKERRTYLRSSHSSHLSVQSVYVMYTDVAVAFTTFTGHQVGGFPVSKASNSLPGPRSRCQNPVGLLFISSSERTFIAPLTISLEAPSY